MTKPTAPKKPAATNRKHYSPEYKANALKLAERVGVAKAAEELKLPQAQLYNWRKSADQKASISEREQKLADENARLKRLLAEKEEEVAIIKKAAAYFAKGLK